MVPGWRRTVLDGAWRSCATQRSDFPVHEGGVAGQTLHQLRIRMSGIGVQPGYDGQQGLETFAQQNQVGARA